MFILMLLLTIEATLKSLPYILQPGSAVVHWRHESLVTAVTTDLTVVTILLVPGPGQPTLSRSVSMPDPRCQMLPIVVRLHSVPEL